MTRCDGRLRGSGRSRAYNPSASARVSASSDSRKRPRSKTPVPSASPAAVGPDAPVGEDRRVEHPGDRRRQLVGLEQVLDPGLLVGQEQEQPEQLDLDRGDRLHDLLGADRLGRGAHGVERDPGAGMLAADRRTTTARGADRSIGPTMERFEQRLLADRRSAREQLDVGVADHRVADLAERRQDRVDQLLAALRRPHVGLRGVIVDEIGQDRIRGPDRLAPQVGRLADDLVGILALGQPDDADVGQADAAIGLDLADEVVQLGHPERARGLAGRVDVVGQCDLLRVAGQERDLAGGERGPERCRRRCRTRPGGP